MCFISCSSNHCNCVVDDEVIAVNDSLLNDYFKNREYILGNFQALGQDLIDDDKNETIRLSISGGFGFKKDWKIVAGSDGATLYITEVDKNGNYGPHIVRSYMQFLTTPEF